MSSVIDIAKKIAPLYRAGYMPPLEVVQETLARGEIDLGMSGLIEWEAMDVTPEDYDSLSKFMGLKALEETPPSWVNTFENWDIYQYEITHGVSAEEHFRLVSDERRYARLRQEALEANDDKLAAEYLKKLLDASDALSSFLQDRLSPSK